MNGTMPLQRLVISNVKAAARGRWLEILRNVAGIPGELLDGRHHPCPKCPDHGTDRFRAFNDIDETGGVICSQCHATNNRDGFATTQWFTGLDFRSAMQAIADYLGPVANSCSSPITTDIVADVARLKRMPLESFIAFGAKPDTHGKLVVSRVPMFSARSLPSSRRHERLGRRLNQIAHEEIVVGLLLIR